MDPYNNPADNLLLSQTIGSTAVINKVGVLPLPYAGYSTSNTLNNALKPFPQFSNVTGGAGSPTGSTWYDSLALKATKRMSKGLQVNGTYTWSKALTLTREDFYHPVANSKSVQSTDQPQILSVNVIYQTQKYFGNRLANAVTQGWQVGMFTGYASGVPLAPPASSTTNNLFTSEMVRTGQPLYLKSLDCHCINPTSEQVLNPAAWVTPVAGTAGPGPTTLFYSDFRAQRHPQESFNILRNFKFGKGDKPVNLSIRADFANVFNRTYMPNPTTSNPQTLPTKDKSGNYTGGFGVINVINAVGAYPTAGAALPRTGTLVARITF